MKVKWLLMFGLVATLLLGACGDGSDENAETQDQAIATPVATMAPAATEASATATLETAATATATEESGTTDTGATGAMTGTGTMTNTGMMTDTSTTMGTGSTTGTMTGTGAMTHTDTLTGAGAAAGAASASTTAIAGTADTTETADLQTQEQIETYGVVRASELMDFNVTNTGGDDLGSVDDAIVTLPDGCIQYVVLSSGGFLGLGEDSFLVPWRAVALNLQDSRLVLNVDQSVFDNAPIFDAGNAPDMNMAGWDTDVNSFWQSVNITAPVTAAPAGQIPAEATALMTDTTLMSDTANAGALGVGAIVTDVAAAPGNMEAAAQAAQGADQVLVRTNPCDTSMNNGSNAVGSADMGSSTGMTDTAAAGATGTTTGTAAEGADIAVQTPQALLLSSLMDFGVKNSNGDDLGSLEDVVIDWQHSRLAYPIISFGGFLGIGDKWFAIPFDAITLNPLDKTFIFDVDKQMLENAPGFDQNQLPDTTAPNWDQEIRSYWGMNNSQDNGGSGG